MKCPNCGAVASSDDEKFCRKCGTKLEVEVKQASVIPNTKKQCYSCGNSIDSDLRICPYCGSNPNSSASYASSGTQTTTTSSNDGDCWGCCILIVFVIVILYIIGLIF